MDADTRRVCASAPALTCLVPSTRAGMAPDGEEQGEAAVDARGHPRLRGAQQPTAQPRAPFPTRRRLLF